MIILLAIYSIVVGIMIGMAIWAVRAADHQLKRHQDALRVPSLAQAMEVS
jgi:hypothetical protein